MAKFRSIIDNKAAKWILSRFAKDQKGLEHLLAVFSGVEKPSNPVESLEIKALEAIFNAGAKVFGVNGIDSLKSWLKEAYIRKAIALTLRSVAIYGITRPQKFAASLLVVWNFTKMCNLRCMHCYANALQGRPAPGELTLEQKLKVVDILDEAGVTMIAFSGGEPLMSRDFWIVAEYASKKGFYTSVATNGTLLSSPSVVDRLAKVGIKYVEISLDALNPEIHNKFRGQPRAWERTVEGIKNVVSKGVFDTAIAVTATKLNYDEIDDLLEFAIKLKVKKFIVFNFVPTGRGREIINLDLSPREREELLKRLYEKWQKLTGIDVFSTSPTYSRIGVEKILEKEGMKYAPSHFAYIDTSIPEGVGLAEFIGGCGAGRVYIALEDNGDIEPCVYLPIKVGNILKDDFMTVWNDSQVFNDLRDRNKLWPACSKCPFVYVCGGCRARAYSYYGNYLAPDPGCILNERYYNEILASFNLTMVKK